MTLIHRPATGHVVSADGNVGRPRTPTVESRGLYEAAEDGGLPRRWDSTVTFTDVGIGEVWIAGGQSNMEFHLEFDAGRDEATWTDESRRPLLRCSRVSYAGQEGGYGY